MAICQTSKSSADDFFHLNILFYEILSWRRGLTKTKTKENSSVHQLDVLVVLEALKMPKVS